MHHPIASIRSHRGLSLTAQPLSMSRADRIDSCTTYRQPGDALAFTSTLSWCVCCACVVCALFMVSGGTELRLCRATAGTLRGGCLGDGLGWRVRQPTVDEHANVNVELTGDAITHFAGTDRRSAGRCGR